MDYYGFFLFTFVLVDHVADILDRAPWHMAIRHWTPNMQFSKDDLSRIPVWIKLYHVPLEYWTNKGLGYVASALGVPLHVDVTTLMRKRLTYARVCVEIDASKLLVKEFDLHCLVEW